MNKLWALPICTAVIYCVFLFNSIPSVEPHLPPPKNETPLLPTPPLEESKIQSEDGNALADLQSELDFLENRIAQRERFKEKRKPQSKEANFLSLSQEGLTPDQWQFSDRKTPKQSVESFLWAGASGDTQAMSTAINLGEKSAELATRLFNQLPLDVQSKYKSPENVIASMVIDDIPLTHAKIVSEVLSGDSRITQRVLFTSNIEPPKFVNLRLDKQENDEWKISIPPAAIAKYANELGLSIDPH